MAARSSAQFTVDLPAQEVLALLKRRIALQERFSLSNESATEMHLTARPNWATWGARIVLRLAPIEATGTLVQAYWEPALRTTVGTYGQGARDLYALQAMTQPDSTGPSDSV